MNRLARRYAVWLALAGILLNACASSAYQFAYASTGSDPGFGEICSVRNVTEEGGSGPTPDHKHAGCPFCASHVGSDGFLAASFRLPLLDALRDEALPAFESRPDRLTPRLFSRARAPPETA